MPVVRIPRPQLASRVSHALVDHPLVIVAPAGYGKTTLVEEALAASQLRGAWIRCTPADRHAGRLLGSIVRAVNDAAPGSSEVVAGAGDSVQRTPAPTDGVRALLGECDQLLVDPITIVIDDAEALTGSGAACSVLDELIRGTGPKVGVVVLSRRSLPLRLAKLTGTGRLVELGTGDLAFDAVECSQLLAKATGRSASADEVDGLMTATEGWPLGIATLVQDGGPDRDVTDLDRSFRSPRALRDYLREEVLAELESSERTALLSSAIPRRLTPEIADALELPEDHLAAAGTGGLFLARSGPDAEAFAYHPLFREVLLDQLGEHLTAEQIRGVHRRVAPAVAEHDPVEAIEHWITAGEWSRAVDAIAAEASSVASMSPTLVRSWLDRLPDAIRADTRVQLLAGHVAWAEGDYESAIGHLRAGLGMTDVATDRQEVEAASVDGEVSPTNEWWGRFLLIDCLGLVGRPEEGVAIAVGFNEPDAREAGPVSAAAGLYAAHGMAAAGRPAAALELASRVSDVPDAGAVAPIDALMRAYIDIPAGNLVRAAEQTLGAYRQIEADDPLGMRFNLMAAHATVLGEQGHRHEALDWWEHQRIEADRALLVARVNTIHGLQAMIHAQLGEMSEAEDFLALHTTTDTWPDQSAEVARALVAAARGERASALSAVRGAISAARTAPPLYRWWTLTDTVPALVTIGDLERAASVLDDAAALVEETYPGGSGRHLRARTTVLGAFLAAERGELDRASELVACGVGEAGETAPEILRLEWPRIERVVSAALERGALQPESTVEGLWASLPDGRALVGLADHPVAAVRLSAFRPALGSGHPTARSIVVRAVDDEDPAVAAAARDALARTVASPPPRRFESLGGFRVRRGGWTTDGGSWTRPVDARLVRFLLIHGEAPVPTDRIFEALWPGLDADGARRSLQVSASRIRQLLDHPEPSQSIIEASRDAYRLRLSPGDVLDWQQFERAADVALDRTASSLPLLERAHSLWGGEPLPEEAYSDWASGWRARLVDRCVEVLVALIGAHERDGDDTSAVRVVRELVDLDPYDERSHRLLMAALARLGRRGQALRQYLVCRRMLLDDLGVEPSPVTSALHADILAGRPT